MSHTDGLMRTGFEKAEFVRRLERVGLDREQAEEHIAVLRDIAADNLVTKRDLARLDDRFISLEQRMTIKFGVMIGGAVGLLAALVKILGG
ncbi:CCDC90 family protein [Parvularcula maris]|nr:CCDC90 family protein [Parvularcula maris]